MGRGRTLLQALDVVLDAVEALAQRVVLEVEEAKGVALVGRVREGARGGTGGGGGGSVRCAERGTEGEGEGQGEDTRELFGEAVW